VIGVRTRRPALVALIVSQIYPTGTVRKILLRRHGRTTHYDPTRSRANHVALDDDVHAYGNLGRCNKSSPHQPLHENKRALRCGKVLTIRLSAQLHAPVVVHAIPCKANEAYLHLDHRSNVFELYLSTMDGQRRRRLTDGMTKS
jgi:hypothetical protein